MRGLGALATDREAGKDVFRSGGCHHCGQLGTLTMFFWLCLPACAPIPHCKQPTAIYTLAFLLDANWFISVYCDQKNFFWFVCLKNCRNTLCLKRLGRWKGVRNEWLRRNCFIIWQWLWGKVRALEIKRMKKREENSTCQLGDLSLLSPSFSLGLKHTQRVHAQRPLWEMEPQIFFLPRGSLPRL